MKEQGQLLCETNTTEVEEMVKEAARFQTVFEHGQWYVKVCDQVFGVNDADGGLEFELL